MALLGHSTELEGLRYYYEAACKLSHREAKRILRYECANSAFYEEVWEKAELLYQLRRQQRPSHPWYRMKKEYFVAIMCYMQKETSISFLFDSWCRSAMPTEESWLRFPLKSLFYLLIKAFDLLPPHPIAQVYTSEPGFLANNNKELHFVHFLSASAYLHQALKSASPLYVLVLRDIPATLIRDVTMYSELPKGKKVIIWPFCVFKVIAEQRAVKTVIFDPERSWIEPRLVIAPGTAVSPAVSPRMSKRRALDEPFTHGPVSSVGSAEHPRMSKPQGVASPDVPNDFRHATEQGKEPDPAAEHSAQGTSGTEVPSAGSGRYSLETGPTVRKTAYMDHLRKVTNEIGRDFVITIPRQRRTDSPGRAPTSSGPGQDVDTMRATSSLVIFAAGETHDNAYNAERLRQVGLSLGDDDIDETKISCMNAMLLAFMCIILVAAVVLLMKQYVF